MKNILGVEWEAACVSWRKKAGSICQVPVIKRKNKGETELRQSQWGESRERGRDRKPKRTLANFSGT